MNFESIHFPIEGIVQRQVHFSDEYHTYVFSFTSPFVYSEPAAYKAKNAFLLGAFNPFNPNVQSPEEIYSSFIIDPKKEPYRDGKANLKQQMISLYDEADTLIGKVGVLFPKIRFLKFSAEMPNIVYDASGQPVGFCHFQPKARRKAVYSFAPGFTGLDAPISEEAIRELENNGSVRCHFVYDMVKQASDMRKRLEAMFSAEKKSEMVINRIAMIQKPDSNEQALFYLTALMAFFWDTMIEFPLVEN